MENTFTSTTALNPSEELSGKNFVELVKEALGRQESEGEITFVPSISLIHEILTFRRRPENDSTVNAVIEHIKDFRDNLELDPDHGKEIYRVRLTVNGNKELELSECEKLSDADSFEVEIYTQSAYTPMGDVFIGDLLENEVFDYKMVQDYGDSGEFYISYVKDGKDMEGSSLSLDISELLERNDLWATEQCSIAIDFKNGTDRVFLESLRNITRECLSEDDLPCCESLWEDEEEEALEEGDGKSNWLICPNAIFTSLPDTKAYLDKLNAALEPFTGQFECSCYDSGNNEDCCLLIDFENFGIAKIFWTEETGFAIAGAYL